MAVQMAHVSFLNTNQTKCLYTVSSNRQHNLNIPETLINVNTTPRVGYSLSFLEVGFPFYYPLMTQIIFVDHHQHG